MSAIFGTLRRNNSPSDSDEKLPQFDFPEIRAQALSFESLVIFSNIDQNKTKTKTDERSSLCWIGMNYFSLYMFDEQWKDLITLPLVFSFKRCLKTHSYDRRLKKNYEQYSLTRMNPLTCCNPSGIKLRMVNGTVVWL